MTQTIHWFSDRIGHVTGAQFDGVRVFLAAMLLIAVARPATTLVSISDEWSGLSAPVMLDGTLVTKSYYGPPNFGETPDLDRIDRVRVIELALPLRVRNERTREELLVTEMQILPPSAEDPILKDVLDGRKIRITAWLAFAQTGGHHTQIVVFRLLEIVSAPGS